MWEDMPPWREWGIRKRQQREWGPGLGERDLTARREEVGKKGHVRGELCVAWGKLLSYSLLQFLFLLHRFTVSLCCAVGGVENAWEALL